MKRIVLLIAAGAALGAPQVQASAELAKKYNCAACHAPDKKVVGPAWQDVSAKYKGQSDMPDKLVAKVKAGGKGVWGPVPMPPNNVPEEDIRTLVAWALAGGK
ncbi:MULTISPECIES: c-type cytochrome [Niveibacterium]|uniref:C-type cytochrome n=1 Tax=Niveibacterium microcysteis TaxID=2811415 RepID=A0ABX7MA84_9RHOO|nr:MULTISPECIES: c-type cytochrome [Niveibacterium]QSI77569.1 c-type cytochrome [Niveibacterium microcysteis]